MARPLEKIGDINDRKELWKIAVKVHHKWKVTTGNKEHFAMVVVAASGTDIHVIVPTAYKQIFDSDLDVNTTCTLSNFQVQPNELMFKVTSHKFVLKFTAGTTIIDVGKHDIPPKVHVLTPFADIISGKWPTNVLCDVLGVVDDVGYAHPLGSGKKPQVNLILRDLGDNNLHCTLWEDYACKFFEYMQQRLDPNIPTIILIHYAKVKEAGKYLLAVTNTYNVTTMHINEDFPEINDFLLRLPKDTKKLTNTTTTSSRKWSQQSGSSQITPTQKFLDNAVTVRLHEISSLADSTLYVTVATTDKLIADGNGWCYRSCHQCTQHAKGDQPPFFCRSGHRTEYDIWRFKIVVEVIHEGNHGTFVFWDREAAELLETNAPRLRATMIEAGITDPLDYPLVLDKMLGKKFAFKVKWQSRWKSSSVVSFLKDEQLIQQLESSPPTSNHVPPVLSAHDDQSDSFSLQVTTSMTTSIQPLESVGDEVNVELIKLIPVKEGEINSTTVDDPSTPTTAVKRVSSENTNDIVKDTLLEGDLSSTRNKKAAKRGEKIIG